jgi:alkylhydroperoxidase/carboxymuconolactone decarboxylase family protein YurZ
MIAPAGLKEWHLSHTIVSTMPMQPFANLTEPTPRVNLFVSHYFPHLAATTLSTESRTLAASSIASNLPGTDIAARVHVQRMMIIVADRDVVVAEIAEAILHVVLPTMWIDISQARTADEATVVVADGVQASDANADPALTTEAISWLVDDLARHKKNSTLKWRIIGVETPAGTSRTEGLLPAILLRQQTMLMTAWTWSSSVGEKGVVFVVTN